MLKLDRGRGQVIVMTLPTGQIVRLRVLSIHRDSVKLGIEASRDVPILRAELLTKETP